MFIVATIGLIANLVSVLLLQKHVSQNINVKAAYLHLLGDTISSVAVIIGSVLIYFFKVYWVDPVITIIIGAYIIKEALGISYEAFNILMQSTPKEIDLENVKQHVEEIEEVSNIHHLHAWKLSDNQIHFECHADLNKDIPISETSFVLEKINKMLKKQFNISHITIQFGYNCCDDTKMIRSER